MMATIPRYLMLTSYKSKWIILAVIMACSINKAALFLNPIQTGLFGRPSDWRGDSKNPHLQLFCN